MNEQFYNNDALILLSSEYVSLNTGFATHNNILSIAETALSE